MFIWFLVSFILSFILGMFSMYAYLYLTNKCYEKSQSCRNCKHVRPKGGILSMSFCCNHPNAYYVDTIVEGNWTCGFFEFTDVIKEKQFRDKLTKLKNIPIIEKKKNKNKF